MFTPSMCVEGRREGGFGSRAYFSFTFLFVSGRGQGSRSRSATSHTKASYLRDMPATNQLFPAGAGDYATDTDNVDVRGKSVSFIRESRLFFCSRMRCLAVCKVIRRKRSWCCFFRRCLLFGRVFRSSPSPARPAKRGVPQGACRMMIKYKIIHRGTDGLMGGSRLAGDRRAKKLAIVCRSPATALRVIDAGRRKVCVCAVWMELRNLHDTDTAALND